jgi:hypothetical protein
MSTPPWSVNQLYYGMDGMAADLSGNFYISNGRFIVKSYLSTGDVSGYGPEFFVNGLNGLAIDNGTNSLYATDSDGMGIIWRIDLENLNVFPPGDPFFTDASLVFPSNLVINDGYIYVSNTASYISKISLLDPSNNNNLQWCVDSSNQYFGQPGALCIHNGTMYVSGNSNVITRVSLATGNIISGFDVSLASPDDYVSGMTCDSNYLYIITNSSNVIQQFNFN